MFCFVFFGWIVLWDYGSITCQGGQVPIFENFPSEPKFHMFKPNSISNQVKKKKHFEKCKCRNHFLEKIIPMTSYQYNSEAVRQPVDIRK